MIGIPSEQIPELAERMTIERYADGEIVHHIGSVPDAMRYLIDGQVEMRGALPDGSEVPVLQLQTGDYLGQSALSRTPTQATYAASTELRVLVIPLDVLDELVGSNHRLARELGRQLEQRRTAMTDALKDIARRSGPGPSRTLSGLGLLSQTRRNLGHRPPRCFGRCGRST